MSVNTNSEFSQRVLAWYQQYGRKHLPWQQNISPYSVWVSEIMLQQTQVSTVIPYYERFMQRFPTVQALADAEIDEVLHLWTGLGYYARGRNLHQCAQVICTEYAGEFPQTVAALSELPGIGRSTAAAIASISMNISAAILDGNVKRVLTRHFAIEGWPGQRAIEKQLWDIAEQLTPKTNTGAYTQAMMDLGATLCTRSKPQCQICPIQTSCLGWSLGAPQRFPTSKPKSIKPTKQTQLIFIVTPSHDVLLQQQPNQGIWGGLWCPPQIALEHSPNALLKDLFSATNLALEEHLLPAFRHTFSHYHLEIHPKLLQLQHSPNALHSPISEETLFCWYNVHNPPALGLPAPIKKLIQTIQHREYLL